MIIIQPSVILRFVRQGNYCILIVRDCRAIVIVSKLLRNIHLTYFDYDPYIMTKLTLAATDLFENVSAIISIHHFPSGLGTGWFGIFSTVHWPRLG